MPVGLVEPGVRDEIVFEDNALSKAAGPLDALATHHIACWLAIIIQDLKGHPTQVTGYKTCPKVPTDHLGCEVS